MYEKITKYYNLPTTHVKHTSCNKLAADLLQCCSNNLSTGCVHTACSQLVDNLLLKVVEFNS
jgi:hypothetical protein